MHILLTSAASPISQCLVDQLAPAHSLRLTERRMMKSEHEFVLADLGHDASTNLLVRGMDAVIHVDTMPTETNTGAQIDQSTRCTYNLLMAAAAEGVKRVVYLSTLELMAWTQNNTRASLRVKKACCICPRTTTRWSSPGRAHVA